MRHLKSILVATDLRSENDSVLDAATHLAEALGASLTLLHVQEAEKWDSSWYYKKRMDEALLEDVVKRLAARQVIVSEASVTLGSPPDGILKKATEIDADLIVIGAGSQSETGTFQAGPVAQATIEHAEQPVLTIAPGSSLPAFQSLLCPVDHSPVSKRGLINAIRLAEAFGARLHVLSVTPEVNWFTAAEETGQITDVQATYASQWSDAFHKFLGPINFEGVNWTKELRTGRADDEILVAVREHNADLIVMGATGISGLPRMLVGSTTRRVLNRLPCSLLTVKSEDVLDNVDEAEIQRIHLLMKEGQAYVETHNDSLALRKFTSALQLNPYHIIALEGKATVYDRLGEHDRAAGCRRRVTLLQQDAVKM